MKIHVTAAALAMSLCCSDVSAGASDSAAALDGVINLYRNARGEVDWPRLQKDLAAKRKAGLATPANARAMTPAGISTQALVAQPAPAPPSFDTRPRGVLLLRDAYSNQAFLSEGEILSDNGASISYTRDNEAGKQTIAGKGALFYAIDQWVAPMTIDPNAVRLAHYALVPGVEWDIKAKNRLGNLSGSASALLGSEFLIRSPVFDASFVKVSASFTTDVSSGSAQVYGGELAWQPVLLQHGIGTTRRLSREWDMWSEFVPTLNAQYIHVGDNGDFANLSVGQDYLWTGTELAGRLFFESGVLKPYSLFFKYFYLYDALHSGRQDVHYGQVGAMAKLLEWKNPESPTDTGTLSLTVRYTKGTALRSLERNDELFTGLTLKIGSLTAANEKPPN